MRRGVVRARLAVRAGLVVRARDMARARMAAAATTLLVAAALLALALAAAGCDMPSTGGLGQVIGSGKPVTKTYDYSGFTRVVADNGFEVTVTQGDAYAVSVTADDNLVNDKLKIELDGDTLHLGLARLWQFRDVTLKARVTMPRLSGLEASGVASVAASGFASGDPLDLALSGAGAARLTGVRAGVVTLAVSGAGRLEGRLDAQQLTGEVSGAGDVTLSGAAQALKLDASGGSTLDLAGLSARDADLTLSGGADGKVLVTGTLDVSASGGATLEYSGSPQLGAIHTSGGAEVKPAGS